MNTNLKNTPCPDPIRIANEIRKQNPSIGMNGAMQRAIEVVRQWAVANGHAE